jgi:Predicted acetyltransferase
MKIILVRPTIDFKHKALEYRQAHFDNGEYIINGSELFDKADSYEEWLKAVCDNANPETVNPNWVLTDTFFAQETDTGEIVGIIDLRHTLNDFLINFGNCGYSVRPTKRNRGYATEMLKQLLEIAKKAGLEKIHLSVEKDNLSSVRTIVKNGGVYERSFEHESVPADIYCIDL